MEDKWDYIKTEDEHIFKYKELKVGDDSLIITWSSKRARKDMADRDRLIKKAEEMLEENHVADKRGARKYIKVKTGKAVLNEVKINVDAKWDGFYGIETNNKNLTMAEVAERYQDLWQIEEFFRFLKGHLETRLIFHWTDKRILGHLVLCFLAFLIERTIELELKRDKVNYSPSKIREALNSLEVTEVEIEGRTFLLRSQIKGLASDILRHYKSQL